MLKRTDIIGFEANICPEYDEYSNDFYTKNVKVKLSKDFPDCPYDHLCDFVYNIITELKRNNYSNPYVIILAEYVDYSSEPILLIYKNSRNERYTVEKMKDKQYYKELL